MQDDLYPEELYTLVGTLRDYQKVGSKFLASRSAILADDVGMGKTAQAIVALRYRKSQSAIVVSTRSMLRQWQSELDKWWAGWQDQINVYFTTYQGLATLDLPKTVDVLICDEAHKVKNRKGRQRLDVRRIARSVARRTWLLTATPVMNRTDELWSLLNLIAPDRFRSYWRFVETYASVDKSGYYGWKVDPKPTCPDKLAVDISPYFLRREPKDFGSELPPVLRQTRYVPMTVRQSRLHLQLTKDMLALVSDGKLVFAPNELAKITFLRQCAVSPYLLGDLDYGNKTGAVMEVLQELGDRPLVVFAQWVKTLNLLSKVLSTNGVTWSMYHGQMTEHAQDAGKAEWEAGQTQVLLVSTDCGGLGLDLTHADIAILVDKKWTPTDNDQATGRLAPTRQKECQRRPVTIISLISEGSIEEWVDDVLGDKQATISAIMSHAEKYAVKA